MEWELRAGMRSKVAEQPQVPNKQLAIVTVHTSACFLPAALNSLDVEMEMWRGIELGAELRESVNQEIIIISVIREVRILE